MLNEIKSKSITCISIVISKLCLCTPSIFEQNYRHLSEYYILSNTMNAVTGVLRSKEYVCCCSIAGVTGLNPAAGMDIRLLCLVGCV